MTSRRNQPNRNTSRKPPETRDKQEDQALENPRRERKSSRSSVLRMKLKKPTFIRRFSREDGYRARGGMDLTPVDIV